MLKPTFTKKHIAGLDKHGKLYRAYDGTTYLPGIVGLNNIKANDYANVVLQVRWATRYLLYFLCYYALFSLFSYLKPCYRALSKLSVRRFLLFLHFISWCLCYNVVIYLKWPYYVLWNVHILVLGVPNNWLIYMQGQKTRSLSYNMHLLFITQKRFIFPKPSFCVTLICGYWSISFPFLHACNAW